MSIVLSEITHEGAYIVSEAHGFFSRDTIAMSNAAESVPGTVIAKAGVPGAETATVSVPSDTTGNGVLTMDATTPIAATATDGVYTVAFTGATTFNVLDPKGLVVDKGVVAATFNNQIKFAIAAGGTAFVVGDRILVTVARPDATGDTWAPLTAATVAAGVLFSHVRAAASAGVQSAVAHVRQCEVRASDLTWPSGFTAAQLAEGLNQLKRIGIILR